MIGKHGKNVDQEVTNVYYYIPRIGLQELLGFVFQVTDSKIWIWVINCEVPVQDK